MPSLPTPYKAPTVIPTVLALLSISLAALTTGCGKRGPDAVPQQVRVQCITVGTTGEVWPSSGTVGDFLQGATANGFEIDGGRPAADGYTLAATKHDQMTGLTVRALFSMTHIESTSSKCPHGTMVVSEITFNGEPLDTATVGGIVAQWGTPPPPPRPLPKVSYLSRTLFPGPQGPETDPFEAADRPADGKASLGNCGSESCSWARDVERHVVRTTPVGKLVHLEELGGTSESEASPVTWDPAPHEVYVFCSFAMPATMMKVGNNYQVDVFDFFHGPPNAILSSAEIYSEACHGKDILQTNDAIGLGYGAVDTSQDVHLTSPEQIFDRAPQ